MRFNLLEKSLSLALFFSLGTQTLAEEQEQVQQQQAQQQQAPVAPSSTESKAQVEVAFKTALIALSCSGYKSSNALKRKCFIKNSSLIFKRHVNFSHLLIDLCVNVSPTSSDAHKGSCIREIIRYAGAQTREAALLRKCKKLTYTVPGEYECIKSEVVENYNTNKMGTSLSSAALGFISPR